MKTNERSGEESSQEDLIFGKNAVLSYLEQAARDTTGEHEILQNALIVEAMEQARRSCESKNSAALEDLEEKIHAAVRDLKSSAPAGLKLRPALEYNYTVKINKILLAAGAEHDARIGKIKTIARQQQIPIQSCDKRKLDQLAGPHQRHQGVVAMLSPAEIWRLDTFLQKLVLDRIACELAGGTMDGYMVAVLDGVEDPHNLGAIIRAAEAAGVKAVFIPQRRAAGLTGTVAKTSAGALASLPVVRVGNIVQCLETLKKYGFWVAALDLEAKEYYTEANLVRPMVIVVGSEGSGVSRIVKEHCDFLVKIPMLGKSESLNASVAAGIMFYEVVRQCRAKDQSKS
ncbi:MAG: 23S rRNA (guanosine(2251)-2'-O)-methyltransferase RlmB [Candidatus Obscuribacterales bacterium]|nr:23S rRNA (guanosine(2251)-2'-O)-methyltransferase RlmB [Candidatus Obscuribacterales bacterium]